MDAVERTLKALVSQKQTYGHMRTRLPAQALHRLSQRNLIFVLHTSQPDMM